MVVKLQEERRPPSTRFESSVIPSGSKTKNAQSDHAPQFESSVIPSGSSVDLAPGLSLRLSVV